MLLLFFYYCLSFLFVAHITLDDALKTLVNFSFWYGKSSYHSCGQLRPMYVINFYLKKPTNRCLFLNELVRFTKNVQQCFWICFLNFDGLFTLSLTKFGIYEGGVSNMVMIKLIKMNCFMIWLKNDERDGALLSLEFGNRSDDH